MRNPPMGYRPLHGRTKLIRIDNQSPTAGDNLPCTGSRSEEHTSELQSLMRISYAVFCLKKKNKGNNPTKRNPNTTYARNESQMSHDHPSTTLHPPKSRAA